ncbi:hypothetical protein EF294_10310 [Gordonia oryzae]|uniref:Uncharacterized protein n=1 Tax=Gordonia oryzae TaxID=2487349 RepID=A0A3N4GE22_9ACTN|nr:hypothetical protein [Gordonia oryzae]RPA61039.1 hypothetical protein EF294_10310 [Gordonia oryzae]
MVKPQAPSGAQLPVLKLDDYNPGLNLPIEIKGLQNLPPARGGAPTPFQERVIYPDLVASIERQLMAVPSNFGPNAGLAVITPDSYFAAFYAATSRAQSGMVTF